MENFEQSETKPLLTTKIRSIAILNKKKSFISKGQQQARQMCIKSRRAEEQERREEEKKKEERKKPIERKEWRIVIDQ